MGKIAFVFSGQGAQKAGMGKDFYENNESVKELFARAEEIRPGTLQQCFEGTAEELKITENTRKATDLYPSGTRDSRISRSSALVRLGTTCTTV